MRPRVQSTAGTASACSKERVVSATWEAKAEGIKANRSLGWIKKTDQEHTQLGELSRTVLADREGLWRCKDLVLWDTGQKQRQPLLHPSDYLRRGHCSGAGTQERRADM